MPSPRVTAASVVAVAALEDGAVASVDVGEALVEEAAALVDAVAALAGVAAAAGDAEVLVEVDVDAAVSEVNKWLLSWVFSPHVHGFRPTG